ncbi:MAG: lysophospholipid acyltransferase family protein [Ignavibacteriales bacterium]|nr:lysophospholipid acyltransferase family protein [Ignavibacteriales bacterium]
MRLGHVVEYLAFQTVAFLVMLLPLIGARWLGRTLGVFVFDYLGYRKGVTLGNLRRAFPEKSDDEIAEIARGAYKSVGIALFELVWYPRMSREQVNASMRFDHPDVLLNAHKKGKGLLILTAHFGNWELLGGCLVVQLGFPVSGIAKTQSNRLVNRSIDARRMRFGNKVIPMETSLREVMRTLRNGEAVGIVADQAAPKENVLIEFFGTQLPTHQGPSVFCLKMGSPLVAVFPVRAPDGSYDAYVKEVPSADLKDYSDENVTELTRRHVKITEDFIRRFPDQWMWMHKRWKHVPPPAYHSGND